MASLLQASTINCTTHMTTTTATRRRDGLLWSPVLLFFFPCLHFLFYNFRYPKDLGCMEKMHTGYDTRRFFFGCQHFGLLTEKGFRFAISGSISVSYVLLCSMFLSCFQLQFLFVLFSNHCATTVLSPFRYFSSHLCAGNSDGTKKHWIGEKQAFG
ncbi:hypothetical protein B0T20DRAFT_14054 [Sordaria brevicollis]|uniref:Transmembrane protein n=1 Tax=Sordaria brevicollis TaxID=83679 RepID=A0AAE0UGC3_SORBR|nr:hypothetical protein B0T20DRAFT_14054 [Sordaria brevicollis]